MKSFSDIEIVARIMSYQGTVIALWKLPTCPEEINEHEYTYYKKIKNQVQSSGGKFDINKLKLTKWGDCDGHFESRL